jgi:hypothetical protein
VKNLLLAAKLSPSLDSYKYSLAQIVSGAVTIFVPKVIQEIDERNMDHLLVEDISKMCKYGSTHTLATLSTDTYTPSSSSASSSHTNTLQMHHLRLDMMSSIDKDNNTTGSTGSSSSTEISNLLSSKQRTRSTDSSFSDISSDGGGGYYSRYARHRNKSRNNARYFILNSVLTVNNFKVVLSFASWFVSYMIMGVFGGSVAFLHFERREESVPDPLPDFGYDVIPVSCCVLMRSFASCVGAVRLCKCSYMLSLPLKLTN